MKGRFTAAAFVLLLLLAACNPSEGGGAGGSSAPQASQPVEQPASQEPRSAPPGGLYDY